MKIGDRVYFVPSYKAEARELTIEYVGVKHFTAAPFTFKIAEDGPMLGSHTSGSVWSSKDAYDLYTRSQLVWRKLRAAVGASATIPDSVTLEDLEAVLSLLRIK